MKIQLLPKYLILYTVIGLCLIGCKAKQKMIGSKSPQETTTQKAPQVEKTPVEETKMSEPPKKVEKSMENQLHDYFYAIASAPTTESANRSIADAMSLFSSPDVPVLIIFYKADGKESYDEPTTIIKYLNYLKDTKNNKAKVEEMVKDSQGRIKEIILKK